MFDEADLPHLASLYGSLPIDCIRGHTVKPKGTRGVRSPALLVITPLRYVTHFLVGVKTECRRQLYPTPF